MRRVEAVAQALEKMLADSFAQQLPDQGHHAADVTVSLTIQIGPEQVVPKGAPEPEPQLPPDEDAAQAD
jgi:creatinine amidohydrolase/Fe(II)-dependent formamide hydrolase-like protein